MISNLSSESVGDFFVRHVAIFYRVVQVGGDDELGVGGILGDELSDGARVGEVGHFAGSLAHLTIMSFFGEGSGLRDEDF